jgi:hypothetical protein
MAVRLSALSAGGPLPPERFLILISVTGRVKRKMPPLYYGRVTSSTSKPTKVSSLDALSLITGFRKAREKDIHYVSIEVNKAESVLVMRNKSDRSRN